ncbi:MAG: hypothetical protein GY948_25440 [Alphaproteobacteria bacterium]|nr:hypothetical protein [Alphaproteobacteria bacterium]
MQLLICKTVKAARFRLGHFNLLPGLAVQPVGNFPNGTYISLSGQRYDLVSNSSQFCFAGLHFLRRGQTAAVHATAPWGRLDLSLSSERATLHLWKRRSAFGIPLCSGDTALEAIKKFLLDPCHNVVTFDVVVSKQLKLIEDVTLYSRHVTHKLIE